MKLTKTQGLDIKHAREKMNLTQEELGKELFVTKQAVYQWEHGKSIEKKKLYELEQFLCFRLSEPYKRKEKSGMTDMILKPLKDFSDVDDLINVVDQLIEKTPADNAYETSVKTMVDKTLVLCLGYELYARSFERDEIPDWEPDWYSVADYIDMLLDKSLLLPNQKRAGIVDPSIKDKIDYMVHSIGINLFEDFDEDGYRDGFIQQIGGMGERSGNELINFLPDVENTVVTSFKVSLHRLSELIKCCSD